MRFCVLTSVALLFTLSFFISGEAEGQKHPEISDEQADEVVRQNVNDFALAHQLIELGRKNKAPEALITAGGLFRKLARVEMAPLEEQPSIENDPNAAKVELTEAKAPDYDAEANALFAEALLMGRKEYKLDLTPLVNNAKARVEYRSPLGGPKQVVRAIAPGQKHHYHVKVRPGAGTNFGFRSNAQCRVTASRTDNGSSYRNTIGTFANTYLEPGINRKKVVFVDISIHNVSNISGQYQFVLN